MLEKISKVTIINIDIFFDQNQQIISNKMLLEILRSKDFYERLIGLSKQHRLSFKIEHKRKTNKIEILLQNETTRIIQAHCYYDKGLLEDLLEFI